MRYHFFCTMDGFFRILKKTSSEIICTRLYTKVYATSCYCSQSRDILGYVLSLLCTRTGAFFQPPQKTQCNDRFAKKYVTPASLKMSQVVDLCSGHWGQLPEKRWTLAITCYWAIIAFLHYR